MSNEISRLLGIYFMAKNGSRLSKKTRDRVATGFCLLCDDKAKRRGLCVKHYFRYRTQHLLRGRGTRSLAYERKEIKAGRILPQLYSVRIQPVDEKTKKAS